MQGKTHIAIGLAVGATAMSGGGPEGAEWLALAFGSVAPDLDGRESLASTPSAWLPRFIPFPRLLDKLVGVIFRIPANIFGHRNTLHYPLVAGLIIFAGYSLDLSWLSWLGIGYASHIAADFCTQMGIPLLGPLSAKNYGLWPRFLRLRTGGIREGVVSFLAWAWTLLTALALLTGYAGGV
jgi:inner membrane protein